MEVHWEFSESKKSTGTGKDTNVLTALYFLLQSVKKVVQKTIFCKRFSTPPQESRWKIITEVLLL